MGPEKYNINDNKSKKILDGLQQVVESSSKLLLVMGGVMIFIEMQMDELG